MFLVPLFFLILVICLVVALFNSLAGNSSAGAKNTYFYQDTKKSNEIVPMRSPLEILKERYAKGEINEEEYLKIKRNLE